MGIEDEKGEISKREVFCFFNMVSGVWTGSVSVGSQWILTLGTRNKAKKKKVNQ